MKYLKRALKQFVYLTIVITVLILVMVKFHFVQGDISQIFVNGYDSIWRIAIIILVFSSIYPRIGYSSRDAILGGFDKELLPGVREVMEDKGYRLESESEEKLTFVKRMPFARMAKMWEDRITMTRDISGYTVEGLTKDVVRIVSALEFKFRTPEEDA